MLTEYRDEEEQQSVCECVGPRQPYELHQQCNGVEQEIRWWSKLDAHYGWWPQLLSDGLSVRRQARPNQSFNRWSITILQQEEAAAFVRVTSLQKERRQEIAKELQQRRLLLRNVPELQRLANFNPRGREWLPPHHQRDVQQATPISPHPHQSAIP